MGADLILAYHWTTRKPSELDWEAAESAIESLEDPTEDEFLDYGIEIQDEAPALQAFREGVRADIVELRSVWEGAKMWPRDINIIELGPVTAMITGGMSWGDSPTEAYEQMARIPEDVLKAIGFFS